MQDRPENISASQVNERVDELVGTIKNLRFLVMSLLTVIAIIFTAGFLSYPHVETWRTIKAAHEAGNVINISGSDGDVIRYGDSFFVHPDGREDVWLVWHAGHAISGYTEAQGAKNHHRAWTISEK